MNPEQALYWVEVTLPIMIITVVSSLFYQYIQWKRSKKGGN